MRALRRLALLALAATSTGCLPFPHREELSPEVHGVVTRAGAPVAGMRVAVSTAETRRQPGDPCPAVAVESRTDADGTFRFPPVSHFSPTVRVLGAPFTHWTLCFERSGELTTALHYARMGDLPAHDEVRCDVADDGTVYCAHVR